MQLSREHSGCCAAPTPTAMAALHSALVHHVVVTRARPLPPIMGANPLSTVNRPSADRHAHSPCSHQARVQQAVLKARRLLHLQSLVVFKIEDGDEWTLDLRSGSGSLAKGPAPEKPDLTLTISDANFAQLVMGKLNPQQVGGGRAAKCLGLGPGGLAPSTS